MVCMLSKTATLAVRWIVSSKPPMIATLQQLSKIGNCIFCQSLAWDCVTIRGTTHPTCRHTQNPDAAACAGQLRDQLLVRPEQC